MLNSMRSETTELGVGEDELAELEDVADNLDELADVADDLVELAEVEDGRGALDEDLAEFGSEVELVELVVTLRSILT